MRPQDILKYLQRTPFQPFRLCLSDGRSFEIRHPEMAMVGRSAVIIGVPDPEEEEPIYERSFDCAIMHIASLEPIDGRSPRKNR